MISDIDRYHGVVLRQILVACASPVSMGVADNGGRIDAFHIERAAFYVKHSTKRLPPWQFTYSPEHFDELAELAKRFTDVWVLLVCGIDGIVGLSYSELASIAGVKEGQAGWVKVSRSRKGMYWVSGNIGELARAKPRGVGPFLDVALKRNPESNGA